MTLTGDRSTSDSVLRVEGLTKRFEARGALDGVGLELRPGEVHGLLGLNGAGKTTLLRAVFGLVMPDAGVVELLGRTRAAGARPNLTGVAGFVEEPFFYPYLTARATLEILARLDGGSRRGDVDALLDRVGLLSRAGDRVGGFSAGMRKRLAIAGALLRRPRLMLLDEPTSGLDAEGARQVAALIAGLSADGVTTLFSSHQIAEAEEACHAFTILHDGRVRWQGDASEMRRAAPASSYALRTTDDSAALKLAEAASGVSAERPPGEGLLVYASEAALASYVLELGRHGVAVLRLEVRKGLLATLFASLTRR